MRELITLIESLSALTESSRGLLYRAKGDRFFKGDRKTPEQAILFDKVEYFPRQPGAYDTHEDMLVAYKEVESNYPGLIAVNKVTKAFHAFAVITLLDETSKAPVRYARFFNEILPDMTGKWANNGIPGGFQLDKATSLKAGYGLKPSDIFPEPAKFKNIYLLLDAFRASDKAALFVPGFEMLYESKPTLPVFERATEFLTAIRDDLGEIIGPVALIQNLPMGTGADGAREDLLAGGDWAGSSISFPSGKTNGLVDSYIVTANGVEVGISSKGEQGATASIKNISDGIEHVRKQGTPEQKKMLKKYAAQIKMIDSISKETVIDFPIQYSLQQGFISEGVADIIPSLIKAGAKTLAEVEMPEDVHLELHNLIESRNAKSDLPNYNVGNHALAVLAQLAADDINGDPVFGEACLKFLNSSPIIQLHMRVVKQKEGAVAVTGFTSKYPPNFKGTVMLEASKNYSSTRAGGRMNFAYNGITDPGTAPDIGPDLATAAADILGTAPKKSTTPKKKVGDVGREKRK